jgi:hypothetical protein
MISSTTPVWSLVGSCRHTLRLLVVRMFCPPELAVSLEDCEQLFKGVQRQQRRLRPWCGAQAATRDGDENVLAREHLGSAVPGLIREPLDPGEFQNPAEKRMTGIRHGDLTFAVLCAERSIRLDVVSLFRRSWKVSARWRAAS